MYDLLMSDFFLIVSLHEVSESPYFVFASTDYDRLTSATYAKTLSIFRLFPGSPFGGGGGLIPISNFLPGLL